MRRGIIHQVADLAVQTFGTRETVYHWILHGTLDTLGGCTPIELIWTGRGEDVIEYLRAAPGRQVADVLPVPG